MKTDKIKTWKRARIYAQELANKNKATYYAFREWDGSIAIEAYYPKNAQFETFIPSNDFEPLDGSLIAMEIERKAREDREQQALWEREHDAFHFEKPIIA